MIPVPARTLIASAARVALLVGSFALALLAAESGFRLCGVRPAFHQPFRERLLLRSDLRNVKAPFGFVPHALLLLTYDSNPRGYFDDQNTVEHAFNSVGWRDDEHAREKPADTYRILGLGDSYLFGQGVRPEDVCLKQLEQQLDGVMKKRVETINSGRRALNTQDQLGVLVGRGLDYDPDLVIVHFVLNDVEPSDTLLREGPKLDFTDQYQLPSLAPDRLSKVSRVWGWSRQRWLRWRQGDRYIRDCLDSFSEDGPKWRACQQALSEIHTICRRRKTPLLVVVFPFLHELDGDYPFQRIHQAVRDHCDRSGIACLDLRDHYTEFHGPELWVHPTDQHPNEIAHRIAGKVIAEYLVNKRFEWLVGQTAAHAAVSRSLRDRDHSIDQQPSQRIR